MLPAGIEPATIILKHQHAIHSATPVPSDGNPIGDYHRRLVEGLIRHSDKPQLGVRQYQANAIWHSKKNIAAEAAVKRKR